MTIIKHPPIIDISHWVPVANFRALDPKPWMVLTKATEGDNFLDATYADYAVGIRDAGYRLGAYHFIRPGDPIRQADWFCEVVLTVGLKGDEVLALDLEVRDVSLAQCKAFLDRTQLKTGIRPIFYSSQLIIEDLYPNGVCPAWLKEEWLWIAEYPSNPDLTNEIPSWIVPRGCSINRIALWQYDDDGILKGITGNNVDLNLINPLYAQAIGLTEPTNGEEPMPIDHYYEVRSAIAGEYRTIRSQHLYGSAEVGRIAVGTMAKARVDDVFTFTANQYSGTTPIAKAGDRWVHVFENNGSPIDGWAAEVHLGVRKLNLVEVGTPGPTPTKTITKAMVYFDDGSSEEMVPK